MAVTVTPLLTLVSTADTTTNWSGNSGQLDDLVYVQGGGSPASYTWQVSKNTTDTSQYTANLNLSAYTLPHLYFWFRCDVAAFTLVRASGGITVRVTSGASFREWRVAGSDTYRGEWRCFVVDLSNTTDVVASSGTLNLASVTQIQWSASTQNINFRAIDNCWNDVVRVGEGLQATGTAFDLGDISGQDELLANQYGVLQTVNSVLFCQGKLSIGNGTLQTTFSSVGEVLIFTDPTTGGIDGGAVGSINDSLYELKCLGNSSNCTFSFNNGVIGAAGTATYFLDLDDTGMNSVALTNSSISDAHEIRCFASSANGTFTGNTFDNCGPIYPQGSTFRNNVINNTAELTLGAINLDSAAAFTNTQNITINGYSGRYAVYIPASITGTVSLNNFTFDGSGTDIYWAGTSGTLTVLSNTATTSATAGGTVSIQSEQVTLTISNVVPNSDVVIKSAGTTTKLQDSQDIVGTSVTYQYNFASNTFVDIAVFSEGYVPYFVNGYELGATNATLPVAQVLDRNYTP